MEKHPTICPFEIEDFEFGSYDFGTSPCVDLTIRHRDGYKIVVYLEQRYNAKPKATICVKLP